MPTTAIPPTRPQPEAPFRAPPLNAEDKLPPAWAPGANPADIAFAPPPLGRHGLAMVAELKDQGVDAARAEKYIAALILRENQLTQNEQQLALKHEPFRQQIVSRKLIALATLPEKQSLSLERLERNPERELQRLAYQAQRVEVQSVQNVLDAIRGQGSNTSLTEATIKWLDLRESKLQQGQQALDLRQSRENLVTGAAVMLLTRRVVSTTSSQTLTQAARGLASTLKEQAGSWSGRLGLAASGASLTSAIHEAALGNYQTAFNDAMLAGAFIGGNAAKYGTVVSTELAATFGKTLQPSTIETIGKVTTGLAVAQFTGRASEKTLGINPMSELEAVVKQQLPLGPKTTATLKVADIALTAAALVDIKNAGKWFAYSQVLKAGQGDIDGLLPSAPGSLLKENFLKYSSDTDKYARLQEYYMLMLNIKYLQSGSKIENLIRDAMPDTAGAELVERINKKPIDGEILECVAKNTFNTGSNGCFGKFHPNGSD